MSEEKAPTRRRRRAAETSDAAGEPVKKSKTKSKGKTPTAGKSKKTATAKSKTSKPKAEKKPTATVGGLARDLLAKGWKDEKIIEKVQSSFPESKFNKAHLSCYRSRMKKAGELS